MRFHLLVFLFCANKLVAFEARLGFYLIANEYSILHEPTSEEEIVTIVRSVYESGGTLKVIGTGHSQNGVQHADRGQLMDLHRYKDTIHLGEDTATFEPGITLLEMGERLQAEGRTFLNAPKLLDFSLGGVMSTGSSGAQGFLHGGISSFIVEMRLVVANGTVINVSENENRDIFKAAQIGLGNMGVMSTITIRVFPLFKLEKILTPLTIDDAISRIVELLSSPTRALVAFDTSGSGASLEELLDTDEPITPVGTGCRPINFDEGCVDYNYIAATWTHDNFDRIQQSYAVYESEVHVRPEDAEQFLREWYEIGLELQRQHPSFVFTYIHAVKADDIWLSPAYEQDSIKIGFSFLDNSWASRTVYLSTWRKVVRKYNGRPHWGKHTPLEASETRALYPRFADYVAQREIVDPTGVFLNEHGRRHFLDEVIGQCCVGSFDLCTMIHGADNCNAKGFCSWICD